jgi:hypothetical protein
MDVYAKFNLMSSQKSLIFLNLHKASIILFSRSKGVFLDHFHNLATFWFTLINKK